MTAKRLGVLALRNTAERPESGMRDLGLGTWERHPERSEGSAGLETSERPGSGMRGLGLGTWENFGTTGIWDVGLGTRDFGELRD
jgi:hypothetical protein